MQARRLDGVGSLSELTFVDALAIAKRVDVEQALLVLDSAAPSASRVADGYEDLVPSVGEILRHSLHFVPGAVAPLPHGVDFRSSTKRELLTYLVDDVRGKARCRLRIVAAPVLSKSRWTTSTFACDIVTQYRDQLSTKWGNSRSALVLLLLLCQEIDVLMA
jgi:hypothetical protein